jgi:L-cysteine/cystine lyase
VLGLSSIMRRFGLTVRVAPVEGSGDFREEVRARLTPRTRAVVMSHVSYQTGWELPVADVAQLLQSYPQCRLVVDGAQGLGNIVVRPEELGADYYIFCGHKWMMAPAGWGGLWIRRENRGELYTRWPKKPYPVDPRVLEQGPWLEYSEFGDDLEFGTRAWPRLAGWSVTWDYYEEEGFERMAQYQLDLADRARQALGQISGLSVADPPAGCSPTALMTVRCRQLGTHLVDHLWAHRVVAKPEPFHDGVRMAWAAFNTAEDLDALLVAVNDL